MAFAVCAVILCLAIIRSVITYVDMRDQIKGLSKEVGTQKIKIEHLISIVDGLMLKKANLNEMENAVASLREDIDALRKAVQAGVNHKESLSKAFEMVRSDVDLLKEQIEVNRKYEILDDIIPSRYRLAEILNGDSTIMTSKVDENTLTCLCDVDKHDEIECSGVSSDDINACKIADESDAK